MMRWVDQADSWPEKGLLAGKGLRVTMMRWVDQADSWPEKRTPGKDLAGKKGHLAGKRLRITTMRWG